MISYSISLEMNPSRIIDTNKNSSTLVTSEFVSYYECRCSPCSEDAPESILENLIVANKNLRIVMIKGNTKGSVVMDTVVA